MRCSLNRTPFYGESGGQVGDIGSIGIEDAILNVTNTTKNHAKNFAPSRFRPSAGEVRAATDYKHRRASTRNHTAAHLLQAALRKVFGTTSSRPDS